MEDEVVFTPAHVVTDPVVRDGRRLAHRLHPDLERALWGRGCIQSSVTRDADGGCAAGKERDERQERRDQAISLGHSPPSPNFSTRPLAAISTPSKGEGLPAWPAPSRG